MAAKVKRVTQCTTDHKDVHSHAVAPGMRVCRGCHDGTAHALDELPRLWRDLLRMHQGQGDGLHVRATPDFVPYSDPVGDERALCVTQLRAWSRYVAGQRHVTSPPASGDPGHYAPFLATHLDWLCRDDGAGMFCDAVHGRYSAAKRLLYPARKSTFIITNLDGRPAGCFDCGKPLAALIRSTDDLLPSEIRCTGCGLAIPASQWITYGRQLRKLATA